jgi:hypothetical protein
MLLEFKADPNLTKAQDYSPLLRALANRRFSTCRVLLRHGADVFTTHENQNIITWSALDQLDRYTSKTNFEILKNVSQWDTGICVLEQGDRILDNLGSPYYQNSVVTFSHPHRIWNLQKLVIQMKNKTAERVCKYLERAIRVKALACSILKYI